MACEIELFFRCYWVIKGLEAGREKWGGALHLRWYALDQGMRQYQAIADQSRSSGLRCYNTVYVQVSVGRKSKLFPSRVVARTTHPCGLSAFNAKQNEGVRVLRAGKNVRKAVKASVGAVTRTPDWLIGARAAAALISIQSCVTFCRPLACVNSKYISILIVGFSSLFLSKAIKGSV